MKKAVDADLLKLKPDLAHLGQLKPDLAHLGRLVVPSGKNYSTAAVDQKNDFPQKKLFSGEH